jgi:asparagine synthetase B (glutamine-hydrolysing)
MCGIYCSNLSQLEEGYGKTLLNLRGPDHLSEIKIEDFYIAHSLLSITGDITPQPYTKENIVCLYNGEIYNHKDYGDYKTDGEAIIDAYLDDGVYFPQNLDGEFAIVLIDVLKKLLIISTDTFSTKPIYYSLEGKTFGCSSYRRPLEEAGHDNIKKLPPNTVRVINMLHPDHAMHIDHPVTTFNLEQKNNSFDGWITAFEKSIEKRTQNCKKKIFIGLSSGHDSGCIYNELIKQGIAFKAYSVRGDENDVIIDERKSIIEFETDCYHKSLFKSKEAYEKAHAYIVKNTEPYNYVIESDYGDYNEFWRNLVSDSGSNWLSWVCEHAKKDEYKVCLSGMGADEIISDYGFNGSRYFMHSNFGGLFPNDLEDIFPWASFFGSSMESYIVKEEYVGGAYGIETRYPFLDKQVVQEFLNLSQDLKNNNYKSAIHEYLQKNNVPFSPNTKLGF